MASMKECIENDINEYCEEYGSDCYEISKRHMDSCDTTEEAYTMANEEYGDNCDEDLDTIFDLLAELKKEELKEKGVEEKGVDTDSDDELMKPKVVAGKCGGVKKDGEPCTYKACEEDGFCKRHSKVVSPKVKAAKVVRDWGEWEDVDSDCEEDPDFDYQYEEIWVEC
jgi:hypothetical protein